MITDLVFNRFGNSTGTVTNSGDLSSVISLLNSLHIKVDSKSIPHFNSDNTFMPIPKKLIPTGKIPYIIIFASIQDGGAAKIWDTVNGTFVNLSGSIPIGCYIAHITSYKHEYGFVLPAIPYISREYTAHLFYANSINTADIETDEIIATLKFNDFDRK